jgi:hypothetical protein
MMNEGPLALLPEIILALAAVAGLLLGSYLPRQRQWPVRLQTALACAGALAATLAVWSGPAGRCSAARTRSTSPPTPGAPSPWSPSC